MSDRKSSRSTVGKRYTASQRAKIVRLASRIGVSGAAERSGASTWSIYRWRHEVDLKRSSAGANGTSGEAVKPTRIQVPRSTVSQVIEVWKHNPGFGPSQVRNQLRRVGVRCDTKTIRKILKAHGYMFLGARNGKSRVTLG